MSRRRRIAVPLIVLGTLALAVWLVVRWPYLTREPVGPPQRELPPEIECDCAQIIARTEPDTGIDWKKLDELTEKFRALRGHTEADIVARYGPPEHRWEGSYGRGTREFSVKYPDAVTAFYKRGTCWLYVSYCRERGRLVCLAANLVPKDTRF